MASGCVVTSTIRTGTWRRSSVRHRAVHRLHRLRRSHTRPISESETRVSLRWTPRTVPRSVMARAAELFRVYEAGPGGRGRRRILTQHPPSRQEASGNRLGLSLYSGRLGPRLRVWPDI